MKKIFSQIDQQLLINHPHLWATKLHSFLFAYIGIMAATLLIGFTFPINRSNVPEVEAQFAYPFILAGIAFIIWAYQASLYKVTSQFGDTNPLATFKTQLVYLLITTMLVAVPFVYSGILSFRVKHLATPSELSADCNKLNVGMLHFKKEVQNIYLYNNQEYWDTNEVFQHLAQDKAGKIAQINDFIQTAEKYGQVVSADAETILRHDTEDNYFPDSYQLKENLYRISKVQARELFFQNQGFYWAVAGGILGLLFVLFTFMATSLRTFLLSIVVGIVGTMALGLFSAFAFSGGGGEKGVFLLYLAVTGGLAAIGVGGGNNSFNLSFRQISLSIAMVLTPFVPLVLLTLTGILKEYMSAEDANAVSSWKILFLFSAASAWLIWQFIYLPALKQIQTIPVKN